MIAEKSYHLKQDLVADGFREDLAGEIEQFSLSLDAIMADLEAGEITLDKWRDLFGDLLVTGILSAYLVGRKKKEPPAGDDLAWLGTWAATQLDYLNGFQTSIAANRAAGGTWSGAWNGRAQLYTGALTAPYWYAETEGLPLPALPGDGSSACGGLDACGWSIIWRGPHEEGNADCYWLLNQQRHARVHCQQCIERSEKWSPLQVRAWKLELPYYSVSHREKHWGTKWKGGRGSGNWGHAGRRGQAGGSAPGSLANMAAPEPALGESAAAPTGPKPTWAGEKVAEEAGFTLRSGRFLNKDKWAVDDEGTAGPFEASTSAAIDSFVKMRSESMRSQEIGQRYDAAVSAIASGSYTKDHLMAISHGRPSITQQTAIAVARGAGLRYTDAMREMERLSTSQGTLSPSGYYLIPVNKVAERIVSFLSKTKAATLKGGAGSGNWGHAGRLGLTGGSSASRFGSLPSIGKVYGPPVTIPTTGKYAPNPDDHLGWVKGASEVRGTPISMVKKNGLGIQRDGIYYRIREVQGGIEIAKVRTMSEARNLAGVLGRAYDFTKGNISFAQVDAELGNMMRASGLSGFSPYNAQKWAQAAVQVNPPPGKSPAPKPAAPKTAPKKPAPAPKIPPKMAPAPLPGPAGAVSLAPSSPMAAHYSYKIKDPDLLTHCKRTVAVIDSIHGDGPLPAISISERKLRGGTMANFGLYSRTIEIRPNVRGEQRLALAHEIGHHIDSRGASLVAGIDYALSEGILGGVALNKYPAPVAKAMTQLGAAIKSSQTYNLLKAAVKTGTISVSGQTVKADRKFTRYLLSNREVFARAYSQWIATKADKNHLSKTFRSEIAYQQQAQMMGWYQRYWDPADFAPISKGFDELFSSLGWLK